MAAVLRGQTRGVAKGTRRTARRHDGTSLAVAAKSAYLARRRALSGLKSASLAYAARGSGAAAVAIALVADTATGTLFARCRTSDSACHARRAQQAVRCRVMPRGSFKKLAPLLLFPA